MTFRRAAPVTFAASFLLAVTLVATEQGTPLTPDTAAPSTAMPVDPEITVGRLGNGLRYYVRANPKPEKRAELRLVVKAGSILEDDDQRGLAHFVEHMAFNGTRNFPRQDVIAFMQSLGMKFGAHVNAYTAFDETVYQLQVPTDRPGVMDRALLVLEDWARNVTFDPIEIEKERGVIMEEWRLRRGAGARLTDQVFPLMLQGSRYADRLPIGTTDVIQNFKPERLKQFYTDWYRPDLMAVVAVGDFDRGAVENLVKAHFTPITNPASPRPRPIYDVPDRTGTAFAITSDREMTAASVEIDTLLPAREQGTVGVYREKIVDRLFSNMLSARLSDLSQQPDPPFVMAVVGRSVFLARTREQATLTALVRENGIERGLDALVTEAERVTRFGFTPTEFERQKQAALRIYERLLTEKGSRDSGSRADEYIRNFMEQETLPTNEWEYGLHKRFLPEITLDEVNKRAREWFPDRNRLVVVTAPEKSGLTLPSQAALTAVLKNAPGKDLKPYADASATRPLLDRLPAPGAIAKTTARETAGITEWELANGVKVVLKPTTFREDEILFRATSPGGTSLASDADYVAASSAVQLVTAGGIGQFNAVDFRRLMTSNSAFVRPVIGELEEGLNGGTSQRDLETLFQLIYLTFTQPRADRTAVDVLAGQMKALLENQSASPDFAFFSTLSSLENQNHLRRRPVTAATVDQWNLDKSLAFYKDRFADASDFTFVFVGSFEPAAMRPLVERYLGGLPSTRRRETWKDVGVRPPAGIVEKVVEKGIEPKSQTAIAFGGSVQYDPAQRVVLRALTQVLQGQLVETIREQLGGTYSVSVSQTYTKFPVAEYSLSIEFGSDPARTDELVKRVFQEIERLKAEGPGLSQMEDVKLSLVREFETSSRQNGFLLSQIVSKYQLGEDVATIWALPEAYRKLDAATIQQAARTYLRPGNYVRVTLVPEKK